MGEGRDGMNKMKDVDKANSKEGQEFSAGKLEGQGLEKLILI